MPDSFSTVYWLTSLTVGVPLYLVVGGTNALLGLVAYVATFTIVGAAVLAVRP